MTILLLGLNHRTAPVEIREKFSFSESGMEKALTALVDGHVIEEGVILSTCNRTEIYSFGPSLDEMREKQVRFLAESGTMEIGAMGDYLYSSTDKEAVKHLFEVACGLDSMIVGEGQILGQVKESFTCAHLLGFTGKVLNRLFHTAIRAGKRARGETAICQGACSVSNAAVELARSLFGSLAQCRVLLIGAGETGELTVKLLVSAGVQFVIVANRSIERAREIARLHGGQAATFRELTGHLEQADVVISSTSAPHFLLTRDRISRAMKLRQGRPLFLVDIAVPRDIEPSAGDIPDVYLYNIDDLQQVASTNLLQRKEEIHKVRRIISEEVSAFKSYLRARNVSPVIQTMRGYFEHKVNAELERTLSRKSLTAREKSIVTTFAAAMLRKMLHTPTVRLKEMARNPGDMSTIEKIGELFQQEEGGMKDEERCCQPGFSRIPPAI